MIKTSAAGGQHEVHLVLRSPVNPVRDALWQDVVNKNSTEPKVEMLFTRWSDLERREPKVEMPPTVAGQKK